LGINLKFKKGNDSSPVSMGDELLFFAKSAIVKSGKNVLYFIINLRCKGINVLKIFYS